MNPKNLSLTHIIRPSSLSEKAPLLLLLHGYGSNEEDLFSFASELPKEYFIISVRAPYTLPQFGYAWYAIDFTADQGKWNDTEQGIESREKLMNFIDEAIEAYNLDAKNITLLGFSQGCILSLALMLSYPQKIRKVVGLSGYLNNDFVLEGAEEELYQDLDLYLSHGTADQVIPIDWARKSRQQLENLSIPLVYEEFPVGHGVCSQNFYAFHQWLSDRIKSNK